MEFRTYRRFFEQDQVDEIVDVLKEYGVDYLITDDSTGLDSLYGEKQKQYYLKIRKGDFEKVNTIFLDRSGKYLEDVDKDYYLFTFSNEELHEVLSKRDEWNEFDFLLAQKILKDRGEYVDLEQIRKLDAERIRELSKPDEGNRAWIYAGYVFAVLGGILGIFIGWHLSTFKKTLPNGEKIHGYNVRDRTHGNRILIIGLVMAMFWLWWRFFGTEN